MPRMVAPGVLLFLLLLSPLLHGQGVYVFPPGPDSNTTIDIRVPLYCPGPISASVAGSVIHVRVEDAADQCGEPPFLRPFGVKVGPLPPGQYRVEVDAGRLDRRTTTFVVRNAGPKAFRVAPFAIPSTGEPRLPVRITNAPGEAPLCPGGQCTIRVGEIVVAQKRVEANGDVVFDAPPHAPGVVDVTIRRPGGGADVTVRAALYYFDRGAPPDMSVFERVLFPVLFDAPGANGSLWRSEAAILNPRPWFVETYNDIQPIVCIAPPCGERVAPGQFLRWSGGSYPQGVALLVPRGEADELAFSLRVRDLSRAAEGFGTEVPVVREADMFRNAGMTLLDVPLDSRYRVKIRAYVFDPLHVQTGGAVGVLIVRSDGTRTRLRADLRRRNCAAGSCAATPLYGELDLPAGREGARADIYLSTPDDALSWAFASVTNNGTQQVTLVTPDGFGGPPCTPGEHCPDDEF